MLFFNGIIFKEIIRSIGIGTKDLISSATRSGLLNCCHMDLIVIPQAHPATDFYIPELKKPQILLIFQNELQI